MTTPRPARRRTSIPPRIYLCDLCGREYLDYNQMRKHRLECKRERESRDGARGKDDPDKCIKGRYGDMVCRTRADIDRLIEERKLREDAIANRGAVVWECNKCGKMTYDVGVSDDSPGLEVRRTTYCLTWLRGGEISLVL